MTIILAHVDGPSGGGKTTIGTKINEMYPFVKNIDIDDILFRDLPSMFPKEYIKHTNRNEIDAFRKKYMYEALNMTLKPFEYVILVGNVRISDKVTGKTINLENIDTNNKFCIDINHDLLLERRIKRHFKALVQYEDKYYKKIIKKGHLDIDVKLWENERLYWGQPRKEFYNKAKKDSYDIIDQDTIIKKISHIIETAIKHN